MKGGRSQSAQERDPGQSAATLADQARYQLQDLQDDLKLDSSQRVLWVSYADKVQKLADDVYRNRNAVRFPQGATPEQLDYLAQVLRNRLTAIEDVTDAGKALYTVLTPEQKTVADTRLARIAVPLITPYQAIADLGGRGMRPGPDGAGGAHPQ